MISAHHPDLGKIIRTNIDTYRSQHIESPKL
jgi:hypothetical protein